MDAVERHALEPDASFDGGELDCGNGLLLLIRQHIDPLARGQLLEFRSTEISVEEDFPAWCRMTGNELVSLVRRGRERSFLVCKGRLAERVDARRPPPRRFVSERGAIAVSIPAALPAARARRRRSRRSRSWASGAGRARAGCWRPSTRTWKGGSPTPSSRRRPRTRRASPWRPSSGPASTSSPTASSGATTTRASSGGRLDNCQLIPLTDLLPLVDDPEEFEAELRVARRARLRGAPSRRVRAASAGAGRWRFTSSPSRARSPTGRSRWRCPARISSRARCGWSASPTARIARARTWPTDIVRVLREEIHFLLAAGASLVQLDEPVLSEVVFTGEKSSRSFMCGALSEKGDARRSWPSPGADRRGGGRPAALAPRPARLPRQLDARRARGARGRLPAAPAAPRDGRGRHALPRALHPAGGRDRRPRRTCPRLPHRRRRRQSEARAGRDAEEIVARARRAVELFGADRVLLTPDCGFATFADSPVASARVAEDKLRAIARAAAILAGRAPGQ